MLCISKLDCLPLYAVKGNWNLDWITFLSLSTLEGIIQSKFTNEVPFSLAYHFCPRKKRVLQTLKYSGSKGSKLDVITNFSIIRYIRDGFDHS